MTDYTCRNHLFSTSINSIKIELIEPPNFSKGPPKNRPPKTGPKNRKNREQNLSYSRRGGGFSRPMVYYPFMASPPPETNNFESLNAISGGSILSDF